MVCVNFRSEECTVAVSSPVQDAVDEANDKHMTSAGVSQSNPAGGDVPPRGSGKFTATVHPICLDTAPFVYLSCDLYDLRSL